MDQGMTNFAFKVWILECKPYTLVIKKKHISKKKKKPPRFRTCTFEKKTHLTKSSWKMPKDNYDSRVYLM